MRDKPTRSAEKMIHKAYDRKSSVAKKKKKSGLEPQGAWHQEELTGCKLPVVK
jgi:hypothetical protein